MTSDSEEAVDEGLEKLRFDWRDLPAVTAHLQGTGGRMRQEMEAFVVTGIPSYLPSAPGARPPPRRRTHP